MAEASMEVSKTPPRRKEEITWHPLKTPANTYKPCTQSKYGSRYAPTFTPPKNTTEDTKSQESDNSTDLKTKVKNLEDRLTCLSKEKSVTSTKYEKEIETLKNSLSEEKKHTARLSKVVDDNAKTKRSLTSQVESLKRDVKALRDDRNDTLNLVCEKEQEMEKELLKIKRRTMGEKNTLVDKISKHLQLETQKINEYIKTRQKELSNFKYLLDRKKRSWLVRKTMSKKSEPKLVDTMVLKDDLGINFQSLLKKDLFK